MSIRIRYILQIIILIYAVFNYQVVSRNEKHQIDEGKIEDGAVTNSGNGRKFYRASYSNTKTNNDSKLNIFSFNKRNKTTKVVTLGKSVKLTCDLKACKSVDSVIWSHRSRKFSKRRMIGKLFLNGVTAKRRSGFPKFRIEWKRHSFFSTLVIPITTKEIYGIFYCTVKTFERQNSCSNFQKMRISVKDRLKKTLGYRRLSLSSKIYYPSLSKITTIANDSNAHLRDPSTPIFDPKDSLWHFWATRIPVNEGSDGYPGRIYHYFSSSLNGTFETSGIALDVSSTPGSFDSYGTFTPSAFLDKLDGSWTIFYGGVANSSQEHTEDIGMAVSTNGAFGPFVKSNLNPVLTWNDFDWCIKTDNTPFNESNTASTPARVDEAEPYIIDSQRVLLVKTVCENFTALPMFFASSSNDRFQPPFKSISNVPIIDASMTAKQKGFEQARIYPGPDGYLHLTGSDHGDSRNPHFINTNNKSSLTTSWKFVGYLDNFGLPPIREPNIVSPLKSIPGDDYKNGVPSFFVDFSGTPFHINLHRNIWKTL